MMAKLAFQQLLLQSSVSHDPSEIFLICWLAAQKNKKYIYYHKNIIIINVENVEDAFFWLFSSTEQHLFEVEILWDLTMSVFF